MAWGEPAATCLMTVCTLSRELCPSAEVSFVLQITTVETDSSYLLLLMAAPSAGLSASTPTPCLALVSLPNVLCFTGFCITGACYLS